MLTHSASHKLRLKDSITSRLAPTGGAPYRPSYPDTPPDGNFSGANGHNGTNAFTADEKYLEPITDASGMVTNAEGACQEQGQHQPGQQPGQQQFGDGTCAAAEGAAQDAKPYELTEEGEDTPFNWHWKTLVVDVIIWAALLTLLAGVALTTKGDDALSSE